MGLFDPLKENQPIEIEIPGDESTCYRSRVETVLANELIIAAPIKGRALVPVQPGSVIKVTYVDTVAIYTYWCEVVGRSAQTPPTITLGRPIDFRKIQRRNFIRMDVKLPVTLRKLNPDFTPTEEVFTVTTADLSGGGMLFATSDKINAGDLIGGNIQLTRTDIINVIGRVVRIIENPPKSETKLSVGFEFISIDETDRDKIIRYIFNQQRELRRKGLL